MDQKVFNNVINNLRESAVSQNIPVMREESVKILASMVAANRPKRILEIGTAVGYSGSIMLNNTVKNAKLVTIEKDEESSLVAQHTFDLLNNKNVTIYNNDAIEVLPHLKRKFDFIFLDGPKGQYIKYLPYLIKLLNKNGILLADNVLYRGMVNGKTPVKRNKSTIVNNLRKYIDEISSNPKLKSYVLDVEDGISISIKIK